MEKERYFKYLLPYQEEGSGHLLVTDYQNGREINRTCISVQELLRDILQDSEGDTWSDLPGIFQTDNVKGSDVFREVREWGIDSLWQVVYFSLFHRLYV